MQTTPFDIWDGSQPKFRSVSQKRKIELKKLKYQNSKCRNDCIFIEDFIQETVQQWKEEIRDKILRLIDNDTKNQSMLERKRSGSVNRRLLSNWYKIWRSGMVRSSDKSLIKDSDCQKSLFVWSQTVSSSMNLKECTITQRLT